jgi:transcriptional regulator with XRE-family HTH domain
MNRDNQDGITKLTHLAALYRGIYSRVADKLGVDPSYVSRVARGERESAQVRAALDSELKQIEKTFARQNHNHNHNGLQRSGKKKTGKRSSGVSARR